MKPRVLLLCSAALVVLSAGCPGLSARATAQVPGEVPSFLADYVDTVRVGDWFLACVEATAPEERFQSATRNTTAPWVLLDERGDVLAEDLYWRPKDDPWPLQARPFEGFEAGVDVAVLRVDQRYGLIDRAGKVVVEPVYDNLFGFKPGETACPAEKDGKWGCIDAAGRSPHFSRVGASAIGLYDVRGVQKENGAHCQPDSHGAAGEKPFSPFKPLVLAEMQPGHFSDLMLGQAELHTSGHENFSLVQNGGVLPVFCLRVLKRNTIPHVTPRSESGF